LILSLLVLHHGDVGVCTGELSGLAVPDDSGLGLCWPTVGGPLGCLLSLFICTFGILGCLVAALVVSQVSSVIQIWSPRGKPFEILGDLAVISERDFRLPPLTVLFLFSVLLFVRQAENGVLPPL